MSYVLIKGMEMPKNCKECPCSTWALDEPFFFCVLGQEVSCEYDTRGKGCPLVEVKSHGRLIDATELLKTVEELRDEPMLTYTQFSDGVLKNIKSAPTVLEATE